MYNVQMSEDLCCTDMDMSSGTNTGVWDTGN